MTDAVPLNPFLPLCGTLEEDCHRLVVRVYYADTDFSGVVYHGRYLEFFERGRTEFLRLCDIHHHLLAEAEETQVFAWIVRRMTLDFSAPARIDNILSVETKITQVRPARILMAQRILRKERLLVGANIEVALINRDGRPRRLPSSFIEAFTKDKTNTYSRP